ncbi:DUF3089 domain-containing protein [Acetobacterium carbinolicum]|jgi:predicted small secreted protein|uniref:DUF3089 domain-containing protein n=1 Tax=Acetobacterium TaxID=33951 RepID=UPI000DBEB128|nr:MULTISPECIES: DUF3089 domain-containing protein [unclassified Acetobacterium]AWW25488.1 DUF3089 domain-containing protein [Acetobacterium sp. KB-1]MDZ5724000.1 DUF3089 domain-containing protein [Acetobacterium sp. K1/6]
MKRKIILSVSLAFVICCLVVAGCTTAKKDGAQIETSEAIVPTDYSQSAHWLNVPAEITKEVDVFYLYPSAWAKVNADDPIICEIDNPVMLQQSKLAYDRQATAFETSANIFAPYYRQDDAGSTLAMDVEEQQDIVKGVPLTDATAAFEYYIEHYNNGRPFILASHSQGSNVMIYILQDYMKEHPDVYKRMVAAYVLGYSITDDYLAENPDLKFASGSGDTGVIVSYNTQAPTIEGSDGVVLPTAHVINPISWTTEETVAPASDNLGSLQLNADGSVVKNADGTPLKVMNFADAKVDNTKNVLICSTVSVDQYAPGGGTFGRGVFHTFDFPFYYFNIRANAEERVANYLKEVK